MLELLNTVFEVQNRAVFAEEGLKRLLETSSSHTGARLILSLTQATEGMQALHESLAPEIRELFGFGVALGAGFDLSSGLSASSSFLGSRGGVRGPGLVFVSASDR